MNISPDAGQQNGNRIPPCDGNLIHEFGYMKGKHEDQTV
jgi:hypothetical protein